MKTFQVFFNNPAEPRPFPNTRFLILIAQTENVARTIFEIRHPAWQIESVKWMKRA